MLTRRNGGCRLNSTAGRLSVGDLDCKIITGGGLMERTDNRNCSFASQTDNEKFGEFVARLRKEKHLTQKELAEQLFISDKAVSKWERGLSMPNVSMLIPMAEILDVTVTELLCGQRLEEESVLDKDAVEKIVTCSMDLSLKEQESRKKLRKRWTVIYVLSLCAAVVEFLVFRALGLEWKDMADSLLPYTGMLLIFGGWFCIFAKEPLPSYYDEHKINFVSDGAFRMNVPGLHFNNSNWPHILNAGRVWTCGGAVLLPAVGFICCRLFGNALWESIRLIVFLTVILGMFIPMYVLGKKYE